MIFEALNSKAIVLKPCGKMDVHSSIERLIMVEVIGHAEVNYGQCSSIYLVSVRLLYQPSYSTIKL